MGRYAAWGSVCRMSDMCVLRVKRVHSVSVRQGSLGLTSLDRPGQPATSICLRPLFRDQPAAGRRNFCCCYEISDIALQRLGLIDKRLQPLRSLKGKLEHIFVSLLLFLMLQSSN